MYTVSTTGTVLELMDLVLFSEAPANILAADYVSGNIISSSPQHWILKFRQWPIISVLTAVNTKAWRMCALKKLPLTLSVPHLIDGARCGQIPLVPFLKTAVSITPLQREMRHYCAVENIPILIYESQLLD